METAEEQKKIHQFIDGCFGHLDSTVAFEDRPMSDPERWTRKEPPIVQMIFPEDIITARPIEALFVTTHPFNQVFTRDQFVSAAVVVLGWTPETETPEPILHYVATLVDSYMPPGEPANLTEPEIPDQTVIPGNLGAKRGWQ